MSERGADSGLCQALCLATFFSAVQVPLLYTQVRCISGRGHSDAASDVSRDYPTSSGRCLCLLPATATCLAPMRCRRH